MALNKDNLKNDLKDVYTEMKNFQGDSDAALDRFVDRLSDVLITHIKTLKINYSNGLNAGSTPVTGTFNHTVS